MLKLPVEIDIRKMDPERRETVGMFGVTDSPTSENRIEKGDGSYECA